jgi:transposase
VIDASQRAQRLSYGELEGLVAEQAALIETLRARIAEQDRAIGELQARLGQNSRNSSKAAVRGWVLQAAVQGSVAAPKVGAQAGRPARSSGSSSGAPGESGSDTGSCCGVLRSAAECCEGCGGDLSGSPIVESQSRQVFDLPEVPRLHCVEHWIQRRRCDCCGHLTSSAFPAGAKAPVS